MTEERTVRHLGRAKQELKSKSLGTLHLSPASPVKCWGFLLQERKNKTPHPKLSHRPVTTINKKVKIPHEEGEVKHFTVALSAKDCG